MWKGLVGELSKCGFILVCLSLPIFFFSNFTVSRLRESAKGAHILGAWLYFLTQIFSGLHDA